MSKVLTDDYIKKITLLEKRVGKRTSYQTLEPFFLNSGDVIAIQSAAKKNWRIYRFERLCVYSRYM